jgi:hypothetical protein
MSGLQLRIELINLSIALKMPKRNDLEKRVSISRLLSARERGFCVILVGAETAYGTADGRTPARDTGTSGVNSTSSSTPGTRPQPYLSHRTFSRARGARSRRAPITGQVEATHEVLIWDDTVRCDFDRLFPFGCSIPRASLIRHPAWRG